jgi:hypothetical protein
MLCLAWQVFYSAQSPIVTPISLGCNRTVTGESYKQFSRIEED